ncbi:MAG: OmpA family protein [Prevotellaceae bacterium]|nr:OmpA family protein [Candidatus Faecinaster equi]
MKKLFILLTLFAVISANAKVTLEGSKFSDNWSIGIQGGVVTPTIHHAFISDMRPMVGITLAKQLTPIFGLAADGVFGFNSGVNVTGNHLGPVSTTFVKMSNVSLLGQFNLSNFFGGYKGSPRVFEVVGVYGMGWGHLYYNKSLDDDANFLTSKAGFNFNFNLGKTKAWQINIKPAIVWNLDEHEKYESKYCLAETRIELLAGFTYKFGCSNGTHNFKLAKLYNQSEVDGLNAKINDLRVKVSQTETELATANASIESLKQQLEVANKKEPVVIKDTQVKVTNNSLESVVTFAQGKTTIDKSQMPNVARVATYLKNHPKSKVYIKGYASPEGSVEINERLANTRANAVKDMLIKIYNIQATRIAAEGQGIGDMFSDPDWNRVAISTLQDE